MKLGFTHCASDLACFKLERDNSTLIMGVSTDNCLLASPHAAMIERFKHEINSSFKIKDLGQAHWILSIELVRNRANKRIAMSQRAYVKTILRCYGLEDIRPVSTPMNPAVHLTPDQSPKTGKEHAQMHGMPYRKMLGAVGYLVRAMRPDCAAAHSILAQFG